MTKKTLLSNQLFILFCLITIFLQTFNLPKGQQTITGSFYEQFYGLSIEGFNLYNYLFVIIIFLFPVTIFFSTRLIVSTGDIYYQLIRYPSFKKWFYQLFRKMNYHAFFTILTLFIYTLLLAVVFDYPLTGNNPFTYWELFYQFIINGFLQLINYHLIMIIFICLTKKAEFFLFNIGILIVLGLPLFNAHWIFPVALNSLGYITGGFYQPIHITVILGTYIIIELFIINLLLSKKLIS